MAASAERMAELHRKLEAQLTATLDRDIKDDVPTDAATLSVIKGFLKDNNITSDPADRGSTDQLQDRFREQARIREERRKAALQLVQTTNETEIKERFA